MLWGGVRSPRSLDPALGASLSAELHLRQVPELLDVEAGDHHPERKKVPRSEGPHLV